MKLNKGQNDPETKLDFVNVSEHSLAWKPEKWALLGLSPKSQFITYLRNNTEKNFTMNVTSDLKKLDRNTFEMETTLTLNPDLSNLEQLYSVEHKRLSDWRVIGFYNYLD